MTQQSPDSPRLIPGLSSWLFGLSWGGGGGGGACPSCHPLPFSYLTMLKLLLFHWLIPEIDVKSTKLQTRKEIGAGRATFLYQSTDLVVSRATLWYIDRNAVVALASSTSS